MQARAAEGTARPSLAPWLIAALAAIFAVLLRWLLQPLVGDLALFTTVFPAVIVVALHAGPYPAILCATLSAVGLAVMVRFVHLDEPLRTMAVLPSLAINLIAALCVIVVCDRYRRAVKISDENRARAARSEASLLTSRGELAIRTGQLEAMLSTAPAAIVISPEGTGKVLIGNRAMYDMLEMEHGRNLAHNLQNGAPLPFRAYSDGQELTDQNAPIMRALRGESVEDAEIELRFDDGKVKYIKGNAVPLWNDTGKVNGAVAAFVDLTDARAAMNAVEKSEARFHRLADEAPVMLWGAGVDGKCDFFNLEWLRFTGRTIAHELGDGWSGGIHPDDVEHALSTYRHAVRSREPFEMRYRLRHHDNTYRWVLDRGAPRLDEHGNFTGFIGASVDIDPEVASSQSLRDTIEGLERHIAQLRAN